MPSEQKERRALRFPDLKVRYGITSRQHLRNLIRHHGAPAGRLLGPNFRVWFDDEWEAWIASRPTAPSPLAVSRSRKRQEARLDKALSTFIHSETTRGQA
jgi:predicted DNA-binding transcriptional regulator AlpA